MDFLEDREKALAFLAKQGVVGTGYIKAQKDEAFIEGFDPDWTGSLPSTFLFDESHEMIEVWENKVTYEELETVVRSALGLPQIDEGEDE